jgi:rubrerythrin
MTDGPMPHPAATEAETDLYRRALDVLGKKDFRPQRGLWAPGGYICKCCICGHQFQGDKRAVTCAPCAYGDAAIEKTFSAPVAR